jgi:hypothetical protein
MTMGTWSGHKISAGAILIFLAVLCAVLLALPAQTITTKYLNDLLLIFDGVYRVTAGLVPNRDFHTVLGPLAYYIPAAGYNLSGSLGGAMPVGMALSVLALAPALVHILGSRLHPLIAVLFGAFLILVLAVPINLGEGITALSFAKYYNRIGWVALGALLVMYLRPLRPHVRQDLLDMLCAALLTALMLYIKISYGVVALAFLVLMLLDYRQRRWAATAIGLVVVTGLVVEAFWQSSLAYLADLGIAFEVGGGLRGTWGQITDHVLGNLSDYVLLTLFAGIALRRTRSIRDGLFYGFCAVAGFLIINQNFQAWGIITLHAAAAVAAETILRSQDDQVLEADERRWSLGAGAKLLFMALVMPTIVHCAAALGLHAFAAVTQAGEEIALPHIEGVRLANLWTWGEYETATQYLTTVQDGVGALSNLDVSPGGIFVLDLANPFSMALDAPPPRDDMPWFQWDRTFSNEAYLPAETLLANIRIVMEPKPGNENIQVLYSSYILSNFDLVQETEHWRIYRRSSAQPQGPLSQVSRP